MVGNVWTEAREEVRKELDHRRAYACMHAHILHLHMCTTFVFFAARIAPPSYSVFAFFSIYLATTTTAASSTAIFFRFTTTTTTVIKKKKKEQATTSTLLLPFLLRLLLQLRLHHCYRHHRHYHYYHHHYYRHHHHHHCHSYSFFYSYYCSLPAAPAIWQNNGPRTGAVGAAMTLATVTQHSLRQHGHRVDAPSARCVGGPSGRRGPETSAWPRVFCFPPPALHRHPPHTTTAALFPSPLLLSFLFLLAS